MKKRFRHMFGYLTAQLFILAGMVRRATRKALNTECILALYFHKPGKEEFERCVQWLKKRGFTFISPHDIERIMKKEIPFPKGAVLLTVDDGWQSNVTNVVEVANRHEVPVTIFVATTPVEEGAYWWSYVQQAKRQGAIRISKKALKRMPEEKRLAILNKLVTKNSPGRDAMTVEQIRSIATSPYVTIGSHTQTHPILINCNDKQVYNELKMSRQKLESWIGKEVAYFAYPNGDFSAREVELLKILDYRLAFSSEPRYLTPDELKHHYTLPRFGFLEGASMAENICRITGVWQPIMFRLPHHSYTRSRNITVNKALLRKAVYEEVQWKQADNTTTPV